MTDARRQEELIEVELPAAALLEDVLGYAPLTPDAVADLRDGPADAVLHGRLLEAVRRLNPWIDEDNARRAVSTVNRLTGIDPIETNERGHTLLTFGIALGQTDAAGRRQDRTVRFLDFDTPANNRFEYARQIRLRGPRQEIVPDILIYVNGLPLGVIECKAPGLADPIGDGIEQFRRYQGLGDYVGLGAPRLFEMAQLCIVLARGEAKYGTVGTPYRHWAEWKEPYPRSRADFVNRLGRDPSAQDVLLAGLLAPENLLDLVRNFIVFETEQGRRIKKLARYQQFIAVQEAVKRIEGAGDPAQRGGVIHHTQGSGKSLTMVFLASKLRRLPSARNPTLVIVTDRIELDQQISGTFLRSGFPNPVQAKSGDHLRDLLSGGAGTTVLTTVHKFHTAVPTRASFITQASNVFVMVDEAHRSQYRELAARMRAGLPNACMIAFTGTPIDKKDRSTLQEFGDYIHRYPIDQAVRDGATVPIFYEMRDVHLRIEGKDLERELRAACPDLTEEQFEELKRKAPLAQTVAELPQRIAEVCKDLLAHYRAAIEPNGFKAQLVTGSRDAAVTYKEALDRLGGPESVVIMSASNGDTARLKAHQLTPKDRDRMIERFRDDDDPLKILVVCDMLLTGFDAPVEQVMYLDAPLREHTLLQAIARVNRTADGRQGRKTHGLVVDYWGDNKRISDALALFDREDLAGALLSLSQKTEQMRSRHRAAMRFFDGMNRTDEESCIGLLEPEDVRAAFDLAFRRYAEAVDMVLPDPAALEDPFLPDLKWLARIRAQARRRYRDAQLSVRHYGALVGDLIEKHMRADGVEQILAPLSILSPEFQAQMRALASDEARASEMEHALRHEIHVHRDENPVLFESLWSKLQRLIDLRREVRIDAASALDRLDSLADDVRAARQGNRDDAGLSGTPGAIFGLIKDAVGSSPQAAALPATAIAAALEELTVIDWHQKEDVKRQMRRAIKAELRAAGAAPDEMEALTVRIMDVARARMVR